MLVIGFHRNTPFTVDLSHSGIYGECEFIFASIKVITIVGLIVRALFRVSSPFLIQIGRSWALF